MLVQPVDHRAGQRDVLRLHHPARERRPLFQLAGKIRHGGESRRARTARERVRRAHELIRQRRSRLVLGDQGGNMAGGFVEIDLEEALPGFFLGFFRLEDARKGHDRIGIDRDRLTVLELRDPLGKSLCRSGGQFEQFGGRRPLVLEPAIHHLLDLPGDFPELVQAYHPAAAFERMESAADCRQRLCVAGFGAADRQGRFDAGENFCGLFEKNLEQFFVLRGRRRCSLLRRRGGALPEPLEEEIDRLPARFAPLQAGLEIQAETGEAFGDPVDVGRAGRLNHGVAGREHLGRALEAEHGERAVDLAQLRYESRQSVAGGGAARISVEHLLHICRLAMISLATCARNCIVLMCCVSSGAQPGRRLARRLAGGGVGQPCAEYAHLLLEIRGLRRADAVEDVFRQHESRGHFDHQALLVLGPRIRQRRRRRRDRFEQPQEMRVPAAAMPASAETRVISRTRAAPPASPITYCCHAPFSALRRERASSIAGCSELGPAPRLAPPG